MRGNTTKAGTRIMPGDLYASNTTLIERLEMRGFSKFPAVGEFENWQMWRFKTVSDTDIHRTPQCRWAGTQGGDYGLHAQADLTDLWRA